MAVGQPDPAARRRPVRDGASAGWGDTSNSSGNSSARNRQTRGVSFDAEKEAQAQRKLASEKRNEIATERRNQREAEAEVTDQ